MTISINFLNLLEQQPARLEFQVHLVENFPELLICVYPPSVVIKSLFGNCFIFLSRIVPLLELHLYYKNNYLQENYL